MSRRKVVLQTGWPFEGRSQLGNHQHDSLNVAGVKNFLDQLDHLGIVVTGKGQAEAAASLIRKGSKVVAADQSAPFLTSHAADSFDRGRPMNRIARNTMGTLDLHLPGF